MRAGLGLGLLLLGGCAPRGLGVRDLPADVTLVRLGFAEPINLEHGTALVVSPRGTRAFEVRPGRDSAAATPIIIPDARARAIDVVEAGRDRGQVSLVVANREGIAHLRMGEAAEPNGCTRVHAWVGDEEVGVSTGYGHQLSQWQDLVRHRDGRADVLKIARAIVRRSEDDGAPPCLTGHVLVGDEVSWLDTARVLGAMTAVGVESFVF